MLETEEHVELEPIENVLSTVKGTLENIKDYAKSNRLSVYLTAAGGESYRHRIAKQKGYKANRTQPRPQYYEAVRNYLVGKHGALIVTTREADDELSIRARALRDSALPYVIATIDKDLDQIPGEHYNYREGSGYYVNEEDAERWFWIQVLAGDATDNVPGCWKVGQQKATALIDWCAEKELDRPGIWEQIVMAYANSQLHPGCPYMSQPPDEVAKETAQLVYLQQRPGELWMPPPYLPVVMSEMREPDEF